MRRLSFILVFLGAFCLLCSWSVLGAIRLVESSFATSQLIGWITVASLSSVVIGLGYFCFHELLGYLSVRRVDRLAAALSGTNIETAKLLGTRWLRSISHKHETEQQLYIVQHATSVDEIRQAISTIVCLIDSKVDRIIATESALIGVAVGIAPWPFVDALIVAWRQLRLMRKIAASYGARPSGIGTLRLLKRVLIAVVLADATEHATQWIASKVPSLGGLLPAAGQAVAIIVLTVRLGRACKTTCRPLERETKKTTTSMKRVKEFVKQAMQQYTKRETSPSTQ